MQRTQLTTPIPFKYVVQSNDKNGYSATAGSFFLPPPPFPLDALPPSLPLSSSSPDFFTRSAQPSVPPSLVNGCPPTPLHTHSPTRP